jgi:MFS transporter, PHS family, inorganic phosphate transporter
MAAVFLMQPFGQLMASVVGLIVLLAVGGNYSLATEKDTTNAATVVDRIWRYVVGVGAIPALIAIAFRLTIPESPRYTLDVDNDGARALRDTQTYLKIAPEGPTAVSHSNYDIENDAVVRISNGNDLQEVPRATTNHNSTHEEDDDDSMEIRELGGGEDVDEDEEEDNEDLPDPFSRTELVRFFWTEGNGKYLLGTSICWFLLDFAFYGLGINNPRVIAQIWASTPVPDTSAGDDTLDWQNPTDGLNPIDPGPAIYETLKQDGIRSIITVSAGSLLGSIILIKAINYIPRKAWLVWSFLGLGVLFAVVGGSYFRAQNTDLHALTITLYILCQLLFNLGPNTLTFIVSPPSPNPSPRRQGFRQEKADNPADSCRDLPDSLSWDMSWHFCCRRQTRQRNRAGLPPVRQHQQSRLQQLRLDSDWLLLCNGARVLVCLGLDPRSARSQRIRHGRGLREGK